MSANSTDLAKSEKLNTRLQFNRKRGKMSDFTPPPPPPAGDFNSDMPERSADDNIFVITSHLGPWLVGFIAPLLVFLIKGKDSRFVRAHSLEALNFQISIIIYAVVSTVLILVLIGFVLLFAVAVIGIIFPILAAVKASKGEYYTYPLTIRLLK
jgi:hypothetical protein